MKNTTEKIKRQNIGLDVSKGDFEANLCVLTDNQEFRSIKHKSFANNAAGVEAFFSWVQKYEEPNVELSFTMEATGVYYENLAYALHEKGRKVHVVLPNLAKKYTESLGLKSKTDGMDALALGRLGAERKLRTWEPISANIKLIKELTRERSKRVEDRTVAKNQLHALEHSHGPNANSRARYKELIDYLSEMISAIEQEIQQAIKADNKLKSKVERLTTIPGVGLLTAATVMAETNGFAAIENIKQLQSYAGYDVRLQESGKWQGRSKLSKRGNSHIRRALYFPAMTIARNSEVHQLFYGRLVERTGKPMVALAALQRKLLGLIYSIWQNDCDFDPKYIQKQAG